MDKATLTRLVQILGFVGLLSGCATPIPTKATASAQQTKENRLALIGETKSGSLAWYVDVDSIKNDQQYISANIIELSSTDSSHKIIDRTLTDCNKKLTSTKGPLNMHPPKGIEIEAVEVICRNASLL
jgi:hypothetical protein